jgi:hypothetical protein
VVLRVGLRMSGRCLRRVCGGGVLVRLARLAGVARRGGVDGRICGIEVSGEVEQTTCPLEKELMRKPSAKLTARNRSM